MSTALAAAASPIKPRLRGVSHGVAFVVAVVLGVRLVASLAEPRARLGCGAYCASVALLFGVSAAYHIPTWSPAARAWWRRADHAAIYLLIAGTYTPFCLLVLDPSLGATLLVLVWCGVALGTAKEFLWRRAPRFVTVAIALSLGWVGASSSPQMAARLGVVTVVQFLSAGVLYSVGAACYAMKRPNPVPGVFGYHEIFHLLVIGATALHWTLIAGVAQAYRAAG